MKNILVLSLLSASLFTLDVRASSLPEPKTDQQKMEELDALLGIDEFLRGDQILNSWRAARLAASIESPVQRIAATTMIHTTQIIALQIELKKQQDRIDALENKYCVIQ